MSTDLAPAALVEEARRSLLAGSHGWGGAWQRAAAFLGRQALEDAIAEVWPGPAAGLARCSMSAQLTCLPFYLDDPDIGYRARQCWYALSSACHAHPYELAPTVSELTALLDEVQAFVAVHSSDQEGRRGGFVH